jgi:hypothetical protein
MRKVLVLSLTFLFLVLLTSTVFAAGWHDITGNPQDPDAGNWNKGVVPHTGLQTSPNTCKACHAVHDGAATSYKLLRADVKLDGTPTPADNTDDRANECNVCHAGPSALTDKKPYAVVDPYGEHSLDGYTMNAAGNNAAIPNDGPKTIPEATDDVIDSNSIKYDGLSCGNCHSVHDGYTISGAAAGSLSGKLLRRDPANNGGDAMEGLVDRDVIGDPAIGDYNVEPWSADGPIKKETPFNPAKYAALGEDEIQAAFCGDCHNKNVNWDRGGSGIEGDIVPPASQGERPNGGAHVLGSVEGLVDVYGRLKNVLFNSNAQLLAKTCSSCHKAKQMAADEWPHQSKSHKFLAWFNKDTNAVENFRDAPGSTGDPKRVIPNLDIKTCRGECHVEVGKPGDIESF